MDAIVIIVDKYAVVPIVSNNSKLKKFDFHFSPDARIKNTVITSPLKIKG